jgi:hypothetical protein
MAKSILESQGYIDITKGTSEDFNKLIKSMTSDISNIFDIANDNDELIKKNHDALMEENLFLYRKIKALEEKMKTVESAVMSAQKATNEYKIYKTSFSGSDILNSTAMHDNIYGIMTLPYRDSHRSSINIYPMEFLLKNIDIRVEYQGYSGAGQAVGEKETITLKDDPSLLNIMDLDDASFWSHSAVTGPDVSYVEFKVYISMPQKMVASLFTNSIGIKPHPIYSLTLKEINYEDANSKEVKPIPSFLIEQLSDGTIIKKEVDDIDNTKVMFAPVMASKIEILMNQKYYIKEGDKRRFILGIRGIDIENISVTSEKASFITRLKMPIEGQYFRKVTEPKAITSSTEVNDLISHELLDSVDAEIPLVFGADIGANYNTLYVRTTINTDGEEIPVIKGMEFGYVPKGS